MSDKPPAIALVSRVVDSLPNHLGIEFTVEPCAECGEDCTRAKTTPRLHLYPDGDAVEVKLVCGHCIDKYVGELDEEAIQLTQAQLDELRAAGAGKPAFLALIDRAEHDSEFRLWLARELIRLATRAGK